MATQRTDRYELADKHQPDADAQNRVRKLKRESKSRGWREIEALHERKFLKESLADVWDEDILIDDSIFSDSNRDSNYFSDPEDVDVEDDLSDFDEDDDYYDEEDQE